MFSEQQKQNFYTIQKNEFDYHKQKLINKIIRLYSYKYMPPTMQYVLGTDRVEMKKGNLGIQLNKQSEEIKKQFEKNIKAQNEILRIIQKRNENFGYACGLIKLGTGVGKGNLAISITEYYNTNTLILVTNRKLLQEMIDRFKEFTNIIPDQFGGGKKNIGQVTITTKKSFILSHKLFKDFSLVIVDEMHEGFTSNLRLALNSAFDKKQIAMYGMSGTVYNQDLTTQELEKYFGKIIDLQLGYEITPEFTFLNFHNSKDYEFTKYHELKEQLFNDELRYEKQIEYLEIMKKEHKYILVLSDRISEIERLYEKYKDSDDFSVVLITGNTKVDDDTENLKQALKSSKKILIIGSINKIGTGFNFGILDTLFLISSIKFSAKVIQAVGRILRIHTGKEKVQAYIWNDEVLKKQKNEKLNTIVEEYGVDKKHIKQIEINKIDDKIRLLIPFTI